jgi:hypothetical protein
MATEETFSASFKSYCERIAQMCEEKSIEPSKFQVWLDEEAPQAFVWKVPVRIFVEQCLRRYAEQLVQAHAVFKKPTIGGKQ